MAENAAKRSGQRLHSEKKAEHKEHRKIGTE